jgi:hypothetical protein
MNDMISICRNCKHFESKGVLDKNNNWGLCTKSGKPDINDKNTESHFFRWEDDTCMAFKSKELSKDIKSSAKEYI